MPPLALVLPALATLQVFPTPVLVLNNLAAPLMMTDSGTQALPTLALIQAFQSPILAVQALTQATAITLVAAEDETIKVWKIEKM